MATKRGLYKPVQTNVGKKRNRRPLAQGRLVTAPDHPAAPAPRLQQGVVNEEVDHELSVTSQVVREDPSATPRRAAPRVSHQQSPVATPPIHTLDLSDSEEDLPHQHHTPKTQTGLSPRRQVPVHQLAQVMVLDASRVSGSPHHADVECVTGYERSPATIIRHAPSPTQEETAWHIQVDQVTKAKSTSSSPGQAAAISPCSASSPPAQHSQRSASGERDPNSERPADEETMVSRSSPQKRVGSSKKKRTMSRLAQPSFDDSGESDRAISTERKTEPAVSGPSEVASDSETCSLFEYVPQIKDRPKTAETSGKSMPPKSAKKKKGERTVPSRYMQSTKSKRVISSALDSSEKTVQPKKNVSQRSLANINNSSLQPSGRKMAHISRPHLVGGRSPERGQNRSGSRGKTSTPTHDGVPIMAPCDASAIHPELSMLSAVDASQLKLGTGSGSGLSGSHDSQRKQKKEDLPALQYRLQLSYARYLQWIFVDTKATAMLHRQEKDAMNQMYGLWEMMEKTRLQKGKLEQEVLKLRHMNLLDDQLENQQRSLEPFVRVLPKLQENYGNLSKAVDATRHQIATRGIHMPEEEQFFLESLEEALLESEKLLGTLTLMTKRQAPAAKDFSNVCYAVEKAVDEQCSELNSCGELLSALQSLATHENSLRIQGMQTSK